jgi:hypothetical protein
MAGKLAVSQAVANQLSGFNNQRFSLAAVAWLIDSNHPLSEFKKPAFQHLIALANPLAERTLWSSHNSVSQYVMQLYNYLLPLVVQELSEAVSKVDLSFDGWTTKGGKKGFLGIVAHYVKPVHLLFRLLVPLLFCLLFTLLFCLRANLNSSCTYTLRFSFVDGYTTTTVYLALLVWSCDIDPDDGPTKGDHNSTTEQNNTLHTFDSLPCAFTL